MFQDFHLSFKIFILSSMFYSFFSMSTGFIACFIVVMLLA